MIQKRSFTRRDFLSTSLKAGTAAVFTTGLLPNLSAKVTGQYNVLFIIVDDLRPLLGCYGHPEMHTPNIDALAKRGTLFNRAYCQYPLCNPSRSSIVTGLRPDTTSVLDNSADFRQHLPAAVTLPQHFKAHGYHTQGIAKIYHVYERQNNLDEWSVRSWGPRSSSIDEATTPSWQALDVADHELREGRTANKVVEVLEQIQSKRFFLAVGFLRPHLPYNAPRKYYDLYNSQNFNIPANVSTPKDAPRLARTYWPEIKGYQDFPSETTAVSDAKLLELIRAYAASISYVDALIGRIFEQMDALRLTQNTVVVFVGDHGYHLGEHRTWSKDTLFEVALRTPMLISVPGQQPNRTEALTELVDIYPTLCDACQLPIPPQLEGLSLMPVIAQPERSWKTAAFSQRRRNTVDGYSMRTERYRYTEWGNNGDLGQELYDYHVDPDETVNIAYLPENSELVAQLSEQLRAGWRAALPDTSEQPPPLPTLPWDINEDGVVNIEDLILISNSFGAAAPENPKVDVNKDGSVNIIDLLLVAAHLGETTSAAPSKSGSLLPKHVDRITAWLTEAYRVNDGSDVFRDGIANLEALARHITPEKTALLPNYPNPFNPETWIPYDLAEDAHVRIHIYNAKGQSIRQLSLGFQTAGTYRTQRHSAYWDGRNSAGEPVASGIYFYTLFAGNVKLTRQMVILK